MASSAKNKLMPGMEYPMANERVYIDRMITDLKRHLEEMYPKGKKMLRHAHPKMHGYVKAEFTILDLMDSSLKVGLFKEPRTYQAYIRFSNGEATVKHDRKKDVRGMAIKIMDVPGQKLLSDADSIGVQDLIMIDSETFMSKNIKEFHEIIRALATGRTALLLYLLNPAHFSTLKRLLKFQKECRHVLDNSYYSVTPYLFGENRAVKYHAIPTNNGALGGGMNKGDENYLKTNMINTLSVNDVYFDFYIQLQTDASKMLVEDPTIKWESPFIKVATIRIPKQEFDTEEQNKAGGDASFSPWHSLVEHRPLGGFNRARKEIYSLMAEFRRKRD